MPDVPEERITAFIAEYGKLREKYGIDFMHTPSFIQAPLPDGTPAWALVITPQAFPIGVPSPFMQDENNGLLKEDSESPGDTGGK